MTDDQAVCRSGRPRVRDAVRTARRRLTGKHPCGGPRGEREAGTGQAVDYVAMTLVTAAIVVAVMGSSAPEQVQCFMSGSIDHYENGGSASC